MSETKFLRIRNHLFFWIGYVLFKASLNISDENTPGTWLSGNWWFESSKLILAQLTFLIIKIPFVYVCFYLLNAYLLKTLNRYAILLLLSVAFILAMIFMSILNHTIILPLIFNYTGKTSGIYSFNSLLYYFFMLLFVAGIACSLRLIRRQHTIQLQSVALQKEKTEAELKYLKGQINPHFLFNTLNNIYSLARKSAPQTADAVMKLSKLMRFMLYETSQPTILIKDELQLIKDYIELEKLRYTNRLEVNYSEQIDNFNQRIAPLLMIHFVENAFKHGVSESKHDARINISISLNKQLLNLRIENTKAYLNEAKTDRIGFENVKRQLELIYQNHQLQVQNLRDLFIVDLTIKL